MGRDWLIGLYGWRHIAVFGMCVNPRFLSSITEISTRGYSIGVSHYGIEVVLCNAIWHVCHLVLNIKYYLSLGNAV